MTNRENKRSLRQKIQDFMSTPKGQTIMNYAYNWGASVVIMGTLFKLTHLPGANFMLFAGMGTEVLIFFLSAFDLSGVKRDGTNAGASVSLGGNIQTGNIDAFPLYRAGTKCFTRHRTDEYAQQEPCRYQCYLRNAVA